jgi:hypothetical protein
MTTEAINRAGAMGLLLVAFAAFGKSPLLLPAAFLDTLLSTNEYGTQIGQLVFHSELG